jgi:hypothetical protein
MIHPWTTPQPAQPVVAPNGPAGDLHPDFRDLLAEFARAAVEFAVVGGYAERASGRPRDLLDVEMLERVRAGGR